MVIEASVHMPMMITNLWQMTCLISGMILLELQKFANGSKGTKPVEWQTKNDPRLVLNAKEK